MRRYVIRNLSRIPEQADKLALWHHEIRGLRDKETLKNRKLRMKSFLQSEFIPSMFVAFDEQEMFLGSVAIVLNDMEIRPELSPWLTGAYIRPENRKRRYGSKLVNFVMTRARLIGLEELYLHTVNDEWFYLKLGWRRHEQVVYKNNVVIIMKMNLNDIQYQLNDFVFRGPNNPYDYP